jgi:predicted alpha/beta hydrolase
MGRGAQAQTQQMIDQQLSQQNAMNRQLYGSSQALGSQAAAGYQNLLANPGYTPAEQSAITNLSQSALSSSFNALAQNAANRVARTRNSAGYGELLDSLARTQGQDQANLAQQNQIAFANAARGDTLSALSGLSGLYGTDTSLLGRTLGIPAQLLDASARNAANSNFRIGFGGPGGFSFGFNG